MGGPEWPTHHNHKVRQGSGAEMASDGVIGDEEYHDKGILGLQKAVIIGKILQVPEGFHDGIR